MTIQVPCPKGERNPAQKRQAHGFRKAALPGAQNASEVLHADLLGRSMGSLFFLDVEKVVHLLDPIHVLCKVFGADLLLLVVHGPRQSDLSLKGIDTDSQSFQDAIFKKFCFYLLLLPLW